MTDTTFAPMRRFKQEVSKEDCIRVLKEEKRGVLSIYLPNGYPYGIPLNYYYDDKKNKIYFHGAKEGQKIDALKQNNKVSFSVYHEEYKKDNDWAWYLTSVIIFGEIEFVESDEETLKDNLKKLGLKYNPSEDDVNDDISRNMERVQMLELKINHMTGKLVHEK